MLEGLERFDHAVLLAINSRHTPLLDAVMWQLSATWPAIALTLVACTLIALRIHARRAIAFLIGCGMVVAVTDLTANGIKHAVKRYRPTHHLELRTKVRTVNGYAGGQYGFVSGHSANTFALAGFLFLSLQWLHNAWRYLLFLLPVLVAYSRMYLGVHYPSDVAFGMVLGLLISRAGFRIIEPFMSRYAPA